MIECENWSNHQPLLKAAIDFCKGKEIFLPILEMGMGAGSTMFINNLSDDTGLRTGKRLSIYSLENNPIWHSAFRNIEISCPWHRMVKIDNWDDAKIESMQWSVALIDHSPAERRHIDAIKLKDCCKIVVIHDAEPQSTWYMLDKVYPHYKYRKQLIIEGHEAQSVMLSNFFDVNEIEIPEFKAL